MTPPIVFAGPSLPGPDDRCDLRPPAKAGDLLALAVGPPTVVALIDGVFDCDAAVQHKEVLELLARGFRVLGAASMGALRAAELHRFGMVGIGSVFAAYAGGRITADDEVALLHAPAELGHRSLTEALVDVRATLVAATRDRIVAPAVAKAIRARARGMFWRERTWPTILADCAGEAEEQALAGLVAWLPTGRRSIKARDAALCVEEALRPWQPVYHPSPPRTTFFLALARQRGIVLHPTSRSSPSM